MTGESAIDAALKRLALALDALDAAVDRRREADRDRDGDALAAQVHAFGLDRDRLASSLDRETAHTRKLETANREIAVRLDAAIAGIQAVLEPGDMPGKG